MVLTRVRRMLLPLVLKEGECTEYTVSEPGSLGPEIRLWWALAHRSPSIPFLLVFMLFWLLSLAFSLSLSLIALEEACCHGLGTPSQLRKKPI